MQAKVGGIRDSTTLPRKTVPLPTPPPMISNYQVSGKTLIEWFLTSAVDGRSWMKLVKNRVKNNVKTN